MPFSTERMTVTGGSAADQEYMDVIAAGRIVATVQIQDGALQVLVFDPEHPEDVLDEYSFPFPAADDGDGEEEGAA